ncbi:MAG: Double zinc ribbon [Blastocatellia bacterium]
MKSSTGELLDLRAEANAEPPRSGFTGALELYDELINFLGLSPETQSAAKSRETTDVVSHPEPVAPPPSAPTLAAETASQANPHAPANQPAVVSEETYTAKSSANSGALSQSEDVIRITGALAGFVASKTAGSAMIRCGDCGNPSDSGEMFCIHCGGLLDEPAAASVELEILSVAGLCDDCGAMIESDEIFCPSCGSVMAGA